MKKASVAEVQHNLNSVLKFGEQGEKVLLTRRNKVIAKIVPVYDTENDDWPSFYERAEEMFGELEGKGPSQIILDDREERF